MTERFSVNLEARLSGAAAADDQKALEAGSLVWSLLVARLKRLFGRGRS
jgi:hypothetical protein